MRIKRKKAKKMGVRQEPPKYPGHMKWVRGCECCLTIRAMCVGKVHAHHVKTQGAGGLDNQVVPLCSLHHGEIHTIGQKTFGEKYSVNLKALAEDYARVSPHRKKWME